MRNLHNNYRGKTFNSRGKTFKTLQVLPKIHPDPAFQHAFVQECTRVVGTLVAATRTRGKGCRRATLAIVVVGDRLPGPEPGVERSLEALLHT